MSVKHDTGKTRPSLVILSMSRALQSVSEVATFGAEKYTDDGWREVPDGVRRCTDAMLRHQLAEASGEVNDPESGLPHAAHIAWNALARLDLMLRVEGALAGAWLDEAMATAEALTRRYATPAPTLAEALAKLPGQDMLRPPPRPKLIPDGVYDNRLSRMREVWRGGSVTKHRIQSTPDALPFGTYPDVPRE